MQKALVSLENNLNILYSSNFYDKNTADKYFKLMEKHMIYNSPEKSKIKVAGKEYYIPRKQIAYGSDGTGYSFSGIRVPAKSWNGDDVMCKLIRKIKSDVEQYVDNLFNFVLVNRYNDGKDSIGYHKDDERDLVPNSPIVGVSFGIKREFIFRPDDFLVDDVCIELEHGSIVIINPPTNRYWKHMIPKRESIKQPRISLTFRHMKR